MKKILMAVFAALVTVAWVLPAMAVDTTFYGTYRVRLFNTNNASDYNSNANRTGATYTGTRAETCDSYSSPCTSYQGLVADSGTANPKYKGNKTDNNSWIDQRFRLSIDSKASDQLRGFVQLEIGDLSEGNRSNIWGTSGSSTESLAVSARQAYISFNAGPVRVKAGRQVFGDAPDGGQSFRVSDDNQYYGLLDGGLIMIARTDAFILTTQKSLDPLNLLFGYAKVIDTSTGSGARSVTTNKYGDSRDTDDTLYVLQATAAPLESVTGGVYFLYDNNQGGYASGGANAAGAKRPWWLGAGVQGKFAPVTAKVHAAMLRGSYEKGCQPGSCGINLANGSASDMKYKAYAYDVDVTVDAGPAKIGIAGGKGSGDNNSRNAESRTFMAMAGSYGNQLGARPAIFFDSGEVSNGGANLVSNANGIDRTTLGNITFAELYASVKPMDDLTIGALLAGFWQTERTNETWSGGTTSGTSSTWAKRLGREIDLTAGYKLYKELALVGQAAWFFPGQGILTSKQRSNSSFNDNYASGSVATHDTVSEYFAKIQYDF